MESRASSPGHHIAGPARRQCLRNTESIRILESTGQERAMPSRDFIFWEVDVQADFMLPGGKLYVPGAENILPNVRKLTDAARRDEVFLVSSGCFHPAND